MVATTVQMDDAIIRTLKRGPARAAELVDVVLASVPKITDRGVVTNRLGELMKSGRITVVGNATMLGRVYWLPRS